MDCEGGDGGGKIVAVGSPEQVAKVEASWTGKFLAETFKRQDERRANVNQPKAAKAAKPKAKRKPAAKKRTPPKRKKATA